MISFLEVIATLPLAEQAVVIVREAVSNSIFEFGMLLCFGVCWPISVYKSIKTKCVKGKSLLFMVIVWLGYVSGLAHKLLYSRDLVIALYISNLVLVLVDILLYLKYSRRAESIEAR